MTFIRRVGRVVPVVCLAALLAPACHLATQHPAVTSAAKAGDFHRSDPQNIGATGRPQLLEFFGVT